MNDLRLTSEIFAEIDHDSKEFAARIVKKALAGTGNEEGHLLSVVQDLLEYELRLGALVRKHEKCLLDLSNSITLLFNATARHSDQLLELFTRVVTLEEPLFDEKEEEQ